MIELVRRGRRCYFEGDTFPIKNDLKAAGAHWDPEAKAWWLGDADKAVALLEEITRKLVEVAAELPPLVPGEPLMQVRGNTYNARDKLTALGGVWDAESRVWRIPLSRLGLAEKAVKEAAYRSPKCKECGVRPNARGWPRIYRNGLCSDCYSEDL